jgi:hypothetical protein
LWLLGGKHELGSVIERGRKSGLRLKTEKQITEVSCDDGQEWEGWRIGLGRKLRGENAKLLLEYIAQEDIR